MQEEIIATAKKKYKEVLENPNSDQDEKDYAKILVDFFQNEDAIREAPKIIPTAAFAYYGYDFETSYKMYDELMEEINKKYILIHPDVLKDNNSK